MVLPPNFSFVWQSLVAGSAHPGTGRELAAVLEGLREQGVQAILSLTEEPLDYAMVREFEFDYLHLPVEDFSAPAPEQIDRAIAFIAHQVDQGRGVLVHCQAGIGRTGTVLACFLVTRGHTPDEAIRAVRALRGGSLEVASQENAVRRFAERWHGGGAGQTGRATHE